MTVRMTVGFVAAISLGLLGQSASAQTSISAAVAASDRPKVDSDRDGDRKPAALLAFAKVKAGETIADIMPGQGYFTRLFSHVVGPKGHVFMLVPAELAQVAPKLADSATTLSQDAAYSNISVSVAPTATISTPAPVDLAWTSDNYHDLYAFFGVAAAAQFDRAVFQMVKPGGVFIVIDHVAAAGTDQAGTKRLHRIDPAVVKAQVEAAGFLFERESAILANAADAHDQPVFSPAVRGHTDQFVLLFRKPR